MNGEVDFLDNIISHHSNEEIHPMNNNNWYNAIFT